MKKILYLSFILCSTLSAQVTFRDYENNENFSIKYAYIFQTISDTQRLALTPVILKINNKSADKQSWVFEGKSNWNDPAETLKKNLSVEAKSSRTFIIEVPVDNKMGNLPHIKITGSGMNRSYALVDHISNLKGLIATSKAYSLLENDSSGRNYNYELISKEALNYFPNSWSGYTSLSEILLTSPEFNTLKDTQKNGLKEWVLNGGSLKFIGSSNENKKIIKKFFGSEGQYFGLGTLRFIPSNTHPQKSNGVNDPFIINKFEKNYSSSTINELWKTIKEPQMNFILVTSLLFLFLIFVGPFNLYFLTKKKRLRLLITTPVISFTASLIFILTIILYDGFGGVGVKKSFIWLNPQQNRCVIKQNQIVKNSIMINSTFKRESNYLIRAYKNPVQMYNHGLQSTNVVSEGQWVFGDMFNSRSRRLMTLNDVQSTQASLEFIKGKTPSIRSNFKSTIKNIYVHDQQGKNWQVQKCGPGETVKLQAISLPKNTKTVTQGSENLFLRIKDKKAFFFTAEATDINEFNIATSTRIDWTQHDFLIGGDLLEGN